MARETIITVRAEIVAVVENLKTLHTEVCIALHFPWGVNFYILDLEA